MSLMLLLAAVAVSRFFTRPSAGGSTTTLRTNYDGANAWSDFGNTNVLQTRYLFTRAIDEVLARLSFTSVLAWDLPDLLGSVRDISDGPGTAVIDHIKYDSYGNILTETAPSSGDRFKYTAREYDTATSQYFYRARYYTPTAGRFTSQDPLKFGGGLSNIAAYVGNASTSESDSSGLGPTKIIIWLGRIVEGIARPVKIRRIHSVDEAIRLKKRGANLMVTGKSNAIELGKRASFKNKVKIDPPRHPGHLPHVHPLPRYPRDGHIWYTCLAPLSITTYAEGGSTPVTVAAEVADFFNPFSVPKDIADIALAIFGGLEDDDGPAEPIEVSPPDVIAYWTNMVVHTRMLIEQRIDAKSRGLLTTSAE